VEKGSGVGMVLEKEQGWENKDGIKQLRLCGARSDVYDGTE